MTSDQRNAIRRSIERCENILIVGGTGTNTDRGTFANAVIMEITEICPRDRLLILEDTTEIQPVSQDVVQIHVSQTWNMDDLLRSAPRHRPDRILVSEVRGGEALTLLETWNAGYKGGLATMHANSALESIQRLQQLAAEAGQETNVLALIAEVIDLVVVIARSNEQQRITEFTQMSQLIDQYRGT